MAGRARQRGTIYVLVLGLVSLLVAMGLGGALLARGEIERSNLEQDQVKAHLLAMAYLDIAHKRTEGTSLWRPITVSGNWNPVEDVGGGQVRTKFVDEIDGNLGNDASQPFRVYAQATVGDAVRVFSQEYVPDASNNLTRDPKSLRQEPAE